MAEKKKAERFVSPKGTASYPYLTKPDTKFNPDGEYKVSLIVAGAAASKTIDFLTEQHDAAVSNAKKENSGKRVKEGELPFIENDDGTVTFKFKLKAKVIPKNGNQFEQKPILFDAKGKPLVGEPKVGGGSTIKVCYEVVPYYTAIAGAGVSLRLKAVQIIELKEYSGGGNAESYGFCEEEGFAADEDDTSPFDADAAGAADEPTAGDSEGGDEDEDF